MEQPIWNDAEFLEWSRNPNTDVSHVRELHIFENEFTIPDTISRFTNLQTLEIVNSTNLEVIPESLFSLQQLRELAINEYSITSLSESIGNLTNLTLLSLTANRLTSLPNSIGNLINLRILQLGHNNLTILPESIGDLINIRTLELANNQLTALPESIGNLTRLHTLTIHHNNLTDLPESFSTLRNLRYFTYDGNTVRIPRDFEMTGIVIPYRNNNNVSTINTADNNNIHTINTNNGNRNYNNLARVGIAFQIHEAFGRIDMDALKRFLIEKGAIEQEFEDDEGFRSYLNETFRGFIGILENSESASRNFETIYNRILSRVDFSPAQKALYSLVLEFTKNQPREFIRNYIANYINDTVHAYNGAGNTMSCAKGALERIVTGLVPAAMLFTDTDTFRERGYDRLVSIITRVPMADIRSIFNAHSQECYEAHPEDVAAFRECIKGKARAQLGDRYNNATANAELGPLINSLGLYGGKRRKTRKGRRVQRKAERKRTRKSRRAGRSRQKNKVLK